MESCAFSNLTSALIEFEMPQNHAQIIHIQRVRSIRTFYVFVMWVVWTTARMRLRRQIQSKGHIPEANLEFLVSFALQRKPLVLLEFLHQKFIFHLNFK